MTDKYRNIRDYHEIELAKKITAMNEEQKRIEKRINIFGFLAIVGLFIWFVSQIILSD